MKLKGNMSVSTALIYKTVQSAASNIAIVKYWGKKPTQQPVNPSISFTLTKSVTTTSVRYQPDNAPLNIRFLFEGYEKPEFMPKLNTLLQRLQPHLPYLGKGHLTIESSNTFPHSSGIASSASSMASLAKALYTIQTQIAPSETRSDANTLISEMARLGSGSACRSTMPGWVLWGETPELPSASNQYGVTINSAVHPIYKDLQDSILVIRQGAKAVSSTVGHQLMDTHPYRDGRIHQANRNIKRLLNALKTGDFNIFTEVCEEEALSLHALMMSSSPGYSLMAPESLAAIERIKQFRHQHNIALTYTLDAGPNIHLIYPKKHREIISSFIDEQLRPLCENRQVIDDEISIA
ncbi:diphosphomevalonate decarboxylase [Carboxylicivirga taeanensis]|uniref:diphosphomevalonate decarboxylase n=1 Tax=Carboxylicivirga taeanensis TaxID=1416875 RepID=UPI003F6DC385